MSKDQKNVISPATKKKPRNVWFFKTLQACNNFRENVKKYFFLPTVK
jgi:hypothetical protein